jgi:hypothetical protein
VNPISDGAFDDFRIFHAPEGCELLADGCNRVPPGCDTSLDDTCDDLTETDFLASTTATYEKGNLGFQVEVGADGQQVMALVPEPALGTLLAAGLLPFWMSRRRPREPFAR